MRFGRAFVCLAAGTAAVHFLCGCAVVQVREKNPARAFAREFREAVASVAPETRAERRKRQEIALEAARAHWPGALSGNSSELAKYNAAVGWLLASREGLAETGNARLAESPALDPLAGLDPRQAERIIPAAAIQIGRLTPRVETPGLGVPCVMVFPKDAPHLQGQPGVPPNGLCVPATAVVSFPRGRPVLTFIPTLERDTFAVDGRRVKLAADYSAPLADLIARGPNRSLDLGTMLLTAARMDR
ncbi:MAG: hypothetical protein N2322_05260, partial [Terrimicrobiaceae bacterium]|nr:hypothetical protein [Terrimicrobiaceae bacterium]